MINLGEAKAKFKTNLIVKIDLGSNHIDEKYVIIIEKKM